MTKPRIRKVLVPKVNRALQAFLADEPYRPDDDPAWDPFDRDDLRARKAVQKYGRAALAEFIARKPGCRPQWWWRQLTGDPDLDAPERMRRRLGGVDAAHHSSETGGERYANEQDAYGVPLVWVTRENLAWSGNGWWNRNLPGPAIDPKDPPMFESQPAFLDRHGLFLPGERARLREGDFAPVSVLDIMPWDADDLFLDEECARGRPEKYEPVRRGEAGEA
jgi:hypothetical protein